MHFSARRMSSKARNRCLRAPLACPHSGASFGILGRVLASTRQPRSVPRAGSGGRRCRFLVHFSARRRSSVARNRCLRAPLACPHSGASFGILGRVLASTRRARSVPPAGSGGKRCRFLVHFSARRMSSKARNRCLRAPLACPHSGASFGILGRVLASTRQPRHQR